MKHYLAFLRGINVGGHRIKMGPLCEMLAEIGLTEIKTVLASGNLLFRSEEGAAKTLEQSIEAHLKQGLGYEVATFLRSAKELRAMVALAQDDAMGDGPPAASVYVILLKKPASAKLKAGFAELASAQDHFTCIGREVYWRLSGKMSESPLFDKSIGDLLRGTPNTTRNRNTLLRMSAKLD